MVIRTYVVQVIDYYIVNHASYLVNGSRSTDGQLKRKTKVMYKTSDPVFDEVAIKTLREMTS